MAGALCRSGAPSPTISGAVFWNTWNVMCWSPAQAQGACRRRLSWQRPGWMCWSLKRRICTTALSGGVLWIPGNRWDPQKGEEARVMARRYLNAEAGETLDSESVEQFLKNAPHMVEWFERETCVRFVPTQYPDYHPDQPGGAVVGRSILAQPFDIRALGDDMARLRPPRSRQSPSWA